MYRNEKVAISDNQAEKVMVANIYIKDYFCKVWGINCNFDSLIV